MMIVAVPIPNRNRANARRADARAARQRSPPINNFIRSLLGPAQHLADYRTLVDIGLGQRLVLVDANGFALVQNALGPRLQQVLHSHLPLLDAHQGGIVLILNGYVEDRAAHRDHRGWGAHAVVVGLPAQLLNVDLHAPQQDVQQVPPGAGILAEDHPRVGENFEGTAVGNLKDRETVWSGYDDLARLHGIADIQHPGGVVAQHGNLPVQGDDLGRAAFGEYWNNIDTRRRPEQPMCRAVQSSKKHETTFVALAPL